MGPAAPRVPGWLLRHWGLTSPPQGMRPDKRMLDQAPHPLPMPATQQPFPDSLPESQPQLPEQHARAAMLSGQQGQAAAPHAPPPGASRPTPQSLQPRQATAASPAHHAPPPAGAGRHSQARGLQQSHQHAPRVPAALSSAGPGPAQCPPGLVSGAHQVIITRPSSDHQRSRSSPGVGCSTGAVCRTRPASAGAGFGAPAGPWAPGWV